MGYLLFSWQILALLSLYMALVPLIRSAALQRRPNWVIKAQDGTDNGTDCPVDLPAAGREDAAETAPQQPEANLSHKSDSNGDASKRHLEAANGMLCSYCCSTSLLACI